MIKLTNIKRKDNIIYVDVDSHETSPYQQYNLSFNIKNNKYETNITNADKFDIAHIIYKLSKYVKEGKNLPKRDCIICF